MIKPKTIDIADSNLALFGSDVEKNVKKAAAETEPAWKNAGKECGLQIWRIEKFQVKSWPKEEYGAFFSGDSYIVLYTYKESGSDKIKFNVHFWLGKETTQDEAGTAAYKTVELDTLLGDEREEGGGGDRAGVEERGQGVRPADLAHREVPGEVVAKEEYGAFFSGDSYIVLYTYKESGSDKIKFNVHFWLGKETTQDEAGTAAYKTVELDTLLGDEPVQYREVQGFESDLFLGLFPNGLRIMEGGIDSGFRHVEPEKYEPRLLQLKGKRKIRASQVPLSGASLNAGDAFVLDGGLQIFVWQGSKAGIFEKNKAGEMGRALKDERPKASIEVLGEEGNDAFWKLLGGKPDKIKTAEEGGDDAKAEKEGAAQKKLFRISDADGSLTFKEEKAGKVAKADFDTNDAFVFDAGAIIFVWIGKKASKQEKAKGMQMAMNYLSENKRPATLPIARVFEAGENEQFNSLLDG
eukprot:CAMPEP_0198365786 /NCGR_PEP_ID=MMETSP1450-20131203/154349_1 /TAXON_ID=753684 ORGANISM="Madagascaria erythrocladiodes, Strain CCMP3234" /NCGR_SAMPLE_ID=MMETSP1450 /ASSEMBLY_ACC=CAM_ASM_001115 /LENGTH=465 /DNA_ID=CAMNT_0044073241 /DNA_START=138 /DNA_END=1536 /DNA_ORIENTATION=+